MELGATVEKGSSASTPIDSSNIGFRLLKKHGWKEGTGLGISEQGRLEPLQAYIKKNKRGLGADKPKNATENSKYHDEEDSKMSKKKAKGISKRLKKMQEFEKKLQDKEFERSFFQGVSGQITFESLFSGVIHLHMYIRIFLEST